MPMDDDGPERLYNSREVREALNISERTLRELTASGRLPAVKQGAFIYVRKSVLQNYVRSLPPVNPQGLASPVVVLVADEYVNRAQVGATAIRAACHGCARAGWLILNGPRMEGVAELCQSCYYLRLTSSLQTGDPSEGQPEGDDHL